MTSSAARSAPGSPNDPVIYLTIEATRGTASHCSIALVLPAAHRRHLPRASPLFSELVRSNQRRWSGTNSLLPEQSPGLGKTTNAAGPHDQLEIGLPDIFSRRTFSPTPVAHFHHRGTDTSLGVKYGSPCSPQPANPTFGRAAAHPFPIAYSTSPFPSSRADATSARIAVS